MTTGCGWARSTSRIDRAVERLVGAGIQNITVSVDPTHLQGAIPEFVEYFVNAIASSGLFVTISCTSEDESPALGIKIPDLPNIKVEFHHIAPVGNAEMSLTSYPASLNLAHARCPMSAGLTINVWPDGTVYPCCSTYVVNKDEEISIGNVYDESLESILENALSDVYLCSIREIGFAGTLLLAPNAAVWRSAFEKPLRDPCHLCSVIARTPGSIADLRSHLSQRLQEVGF
jgi:MoaA/NifB/PqqE/SkfB family radical SAM enzyme